MRALIVRPLKLGVMTSWAALLLYTESPCFLDWSIRANQIVCTRFPLNSRHSAATLIEFCPSM